MLSVVLPPTPPPHPPLSVSLHSKEQNFVSGGFLRGVAGINQCFWIHLKAQVNLCPHH